ncbi:Glucose-methanol-choline oxidoreductase, N-terminal [Kalmanozyma brasiliensis GHG001]|uniref:Choline dehydrogenase n=1 Tax=Kalmanozyma brasiliensis (strain GHG001) TaxID=1365824 RepID=V5EIV8_KALBG|nr:Glucose-methanol-choline oxidoreductase, N-terminal [Kalmanozyma brasiliensis GHG001]EST04625.1 Glucose-methanol-choline oxidoreductase, N-terminal [Kalmanozyma brasiliensis GHG001]
MKTTTLVAAATLATVVAANPIAWTKTSPRGELAARMAENAHIASRSISNDAAAFSKKKYDYIIVGAGTAGLALAARLSENGKYSVGVLEAGGNGFGVGIIDTPGQFGADLGTIFDWNYTTTAQSNGVPAVGWPRGKVLGGSSALNFYVWDRSSRYEIDAWEQLGNPGWNWNNLYGAMKKSEKFHAPSQQNADLLGIKPVASDYGSSGPIQLAFPNYISQQVRRWIPALQALGIPKNDQPLAGENVGVSQQPSDINPSNYTRSYSAPAYLFPNQARSNLDVLTNALVSKVNFANVSGGLCANGVSFTSNGQTYTVQAKKEVILSGGTVNTPQLLELSGIGSKSVLGKAGVKVLYENSNVGENMQDHTYSATVYKLKPGFPTLDSLRSNQTFAAEQAAAYKANQTSILTETVPSISYVSLARVVGKARAQQMINEVSQYVSSSNAPYKATLKKQLEFLTSYPDKVGQMELIGIDGYFAGTGAPKPDETYFTILAANQHLFSRGNIHITSSDATKYPNIAANYFDVPFDLKIATAGTEYTRRIGLGKVYSDMVDSEYWPGNVDIETYTKTTSVTEYHPIGTASMLPRNQGGVVDSSLRVYGTRNLRVVDASIMPLHIAAHIQATIYGVAEFAADIIKRQA